MFLCDSRSSESSFWTKKNYFNELQLIITKFTYSEILDGVFQLLHVAGDALVGAELVLGMLQPPFQPPEVLLLLGPGFPGTQGT